MCVGRFVREFLDTGGPLLFWSFALWKATVLIDGLFSNLLGIHYITAPNIYYGYQKDPHFGPAQVSQ